MELPIDVVPDTRPPRFKWKQTVTTPIGDRVVEHTCTLPPVVEDAVAALVALVKQQEQTMTSLSGENYALRRQVEDYRSGAGEPAKRRK